jgi:dolichol-phosphate mannosyltransferase
MSIKKFSKFVFLGGISFLLTITLTYFFTDVLGIFYLLSYFIILSLVTIFNFCLNTFFVFKTKRNHKKRFVYYIVAVIIFLFLNTLAVRILTENLKFYYLFSVVVVTILFTILKFSVYNKIIFKDVI